jgi:AcrR family transcriptional regulator
VGREQFAARGIRATNIEDIAHAAGISKGSFYRFFESKEQLYFSLLEAFQAETRDSLKLVLESGDPREALRQFLELQVKMFADNPLLRPLLDPVELRQLLHVLPIAELRKHQQEDNDFTRQILARWSKLGILRAVDLEIFLGLIRTPVLVTVRRDALSEPPIEGVVEALIEALCDWMLPGARPKGKPRDATTVGATSRARKPSTTSKMKSQPRVSAKARLARAR